MPPQIALVLCTVFVLLLLRLSSKQFPETSHALWIPTIYMLMISSKPLGIWFGIGGMDMEAGSPLDRVVLSVMLCLGIVMLFQRQFSLIHAIHENPWTIILIGYMFVSIFWSDIPFSSFKRWVRELVPLTMAFLLSSEKNHFAHFNACSQEQFIYLFPSR
jgi:exopolysaccharide production protein ExoQ